MTRLPELEVLLSRLCLRPMLSASPAMDTGRCFLLLPTLASDSGSTLCCQQVTLARNSFGEVTESFRTGTDLEEEVLLISDWEEEDFMDLIESLLLISDFEEDFLGSVFLSAACFHFCLSPLVCLGTDARRYKMFCWVSFLSAFIEMELSSIKIIKD